MPGVLKRFVGLFRQAPLENDGVKIEALWCNRAPKAVRRLGTIGELRRIVAAVAAKGGNCNYALTILEEHCQWENRCRKEGEPPRAPLTDDDEVGDPKDVHHIIPPKHVIGYAIEECEDGFALETLETLNIRWTILRLRNKIVGIEAVGMLRHESYGPFHIV